MNQHKLPVKKQPEWMDSGILYLLAACLLIGAFVGCIMAAQIDGTDDTLSTYLNGYLEAAQAGIASAPQALSVLWEVFRYPLACVCLCFFSAGRYLLPLVMGARGFFLAYSISSFVRIFGGQGLLLAAGVFLPSALAVIPCMLFWGMQGMRTPGAGRSALRMLPAGSICVGVLLLAVLYECCLGSEVLGLLAHSVL